MTRMKDEYLGNDIYASFDGQQIVLALRGADPWTQIVLNSQTLTALDQYRERVNEYTAQQDVQSTP